MMRPKIQLLIADVDGTLVDPNKNLTEATIEAVKKLKSVGILFTLVSGRPPFGMRMHADALNIELPIAGFNGGLITRPNFSPIAEFNLDPDLVEEVSRYFESKNIDYWYYRGSDWLVRNPDAPHVGKESHTVQYNPTVVKTFKGWIHEITKIVGISDDHEYLKSCNDEIHEKLHGRANASRSQPYYLDITHSQANKGIVVERLSTYLSVPKEQIATIGDMPSDILMFQKSGLSIAMGNAPEEVKSQVQQVTLSNREDGFAVAVEKFLLPQAAGLNRQSA